MSAENAAKRAALAQARRLLMLMARTGFHELALKRMEQAITWMESEVREDGSD